MSRYRAASSPMQMLGLSQGCMVITTSKNVGDHPIFQNVGNHSVIQSVGLGSPIAGHHR